MPDKPAYEALEAQVRALTKEVSILKQNQRDFSVQNDYLNTFHEITLDLLEKRDLNDLLSAILTRVTKIFKTDTGFLYLLDENEGNLVLKFGQGLFAKRIGYRLERGSGLAGKVWQTGEPIVVEDYAKWEGRVPDPYWDRLDLIAGFPIKIQNRTVGVIGVHQTSSGRAVSQHDLDSIKRFSDLASLGLNNATLYEHLENELNERKQTEEALRESEAKFQSISSSMNDALITMDGRGEITYWNETAEKIFGYGKEEIMGKDLHRLLVPEKYRDAFDKEFHNFTVTGTGAAIGQTLEMLALHKEGTEVPVELSLSSFQIREQWHTVGTIRDISNRKWAEQEREKLISNLQNALKEVKQLSGLLPICANCKKVRDDKGYWNQIESYIHQRSEAEFSHGICPDCAKERYPEYALYDENKN